MTTLPSHTAAAMNGLKNPGPDPTSSTRAQGSRPIAATVRPGDWTNRRSGLTRERARDAGKTFPRPRPNSRSSPSPTRPCSIPQTLRVMDRVRITDHGGPPGASPTAVPYVPLPAFGV